MAQARPLAQAALRAGVVDQVRLGVAADERAHGLEGSGPTRPVSGRVEAGQRVEPYTVRTVTDGASFRVRLAVSAESPLSLQFQEIRPNSTWGKSYGFKVYVDDVLMHVRDARLPEQGGGPYSSFYLETADPALIGDGEVVIRVVGTSLAPTYIGSIWAYADLEEMVALQGMRVPDRMVFVLGQDYRGEEYFRSRLDYVKARIHESPQVGRGMAVLDYFPVRTTEQMAENYRLWLALSREYGLPFAIESTSDWEGTPHSVPDGHGGTFGDIAYQQVLWSPQDQTGPDKDVFRGQRLDALLGDRYEPHYGLSVPNIWGSTPWLTWRNPDLNAFYDRKAEDSLAAVRPLVWDLQRTGEVDRVLSFSTTLESTYWSKRNGIGVADQAYTDYNGGVERTDLYADFNPSTVAAARAEGVDLDPTDGLSEAEKRWLYRNQSYPQQLFADAYYAGLPRERIKVDQSGASFPHDMLRHNVHAEVYSRMQEPYWSGVYPSLTQGIVHHARPGSEYIELDSYNPGGFTHLQRSREFGRIANPNLENSVSGYAPDKTLLLRQTYINGSRYTSIYNWQGADSPDAASNWVNPFIDDLHPHDVVRTGDPDGAIADQQTVETTFTAGDLRLLDEIDVRVTKGGSAPLRLTLTDDAGRVVAMRHLSAVEVPDDGWARFAVPVTALDKDKTYRVRIDGAAAYTFPAIGGEPMIRTGLDMQAERDRSLVIQWRRDAADAIADVASDASPTAAGALTAARKALAAGRYVAAYRLAIKADSLTLPVLYQVAADGGELAPFPVSVRPSGDLDVDVTSYRGGRSMGMTVRGYASGPVRFAVNGFGDSPTVTIDGSPVDAPGGRFTVQLPDTAQHTIHIHR